MKFRTVYATDANGTTYTSENGLLTVPAGTYTVTEEPPQSSGEGGTTATVKDYFAINGGTGDGRRADAPAASVRAAVEAAIEDGLEVGDTANVYIMQKNWTSTSEFTYWADVSVAGVMATHEFTVEVKPYDTSIPVRLSEGNNVIKNEIGSLFAISEGAVIDTVKKAENNSDIILRIYEPNGASVQGYITTERICQCV